MGDFPFTFTTLALDAADRAGLAGALGERARAEVEDLELEEPGDLVGHCFHLSDRSGPEFIVYPDARGGGFVVDLATHVERTVARGPRAGMKLIVPVPASGGEG